MTQDGRTDNINETFAEISTTNEQNIEAGKIKLESSSNSYL